MPIELKGNNYYSKVFKRVKYKLSNSTFWVVIKWLRQVYIITPSLCLTYGVKAKNWAKINQMTPKIITISSKV